MKNNLPVTVMESSQTLPSPYLLIPFALQLLGIALMPFLAPHWWDRHYAKVSVALGATTFLYYLLVLERSGRFLEPLHEYVGFVVIMASLFIVAGGIHIRTSGEATPGRNMLFLMLGAFLANLIGTTGASMLLIRPWVRMNKYRITGFHTAFFIFLIANIGGGLTPIGDPPLFLGFLRGVPFWWTLEHLWRPWLFVVGMLAGIFYLMDRWNFLRAPREIRDEETAEAGWQMEGVGNVIPLAAILAAVFFPTPWREILMIGTALLSWFFTPPGIHARNAFTFAPIREVAWLFLGIFATMVPALDYLEHHAPQLARSVGMGAFHFYYFTGFFSAFLDNAPTYLAFFSVAMGLQGGTMSQPADVLRVVTGAPAHLIAISMGAVFFGAMTYIGNGPNFMVKSIVSEAGVKTPGFFPYLFLYALPILLPVLALAGWLFLR